MAQLVNNTKMTRETLYNIRLFKEFIELECMTELLENARKGHRYLVIDFIKLSMFDLELSEDLLDKPEETIKTCEMSIEQFELTCNEKNFQVRIKKIPKSNQRMISGKRHIDLTKLIYFEGVIRTKSSVNPKVNSSRFECPSCGNVIPLLQLDTKFKEPTRCGCGRKGKFKLLSKDLIDIQKLELEELPENVKGSAQPQKLKVVLKETLTDPGFEAKFNPGAKVQIIGILKEIPILMRSGGQSTEYDYVFEAVHIENIEDEEVDLQISEKDKVEFKKIAATENCIDILKDSIAPSIYGHDKIKEAMLLQIVSGVRKKRKDGKIIRGDMHILLIGDPGSGKSAMLKRIETILPHARVANGKGASGVGLTAAVTKDEFIGGWTFQAGTLVLAHKSLAIIDEFDKMSKDDRDAMHEALEQQTVTISKAGVQARLRSECSLLAGANPKFGRFDPYKKTIIEQIDLPPTLVNRFDLIFPVKDIPNPNKDERLANHICNLNVDMEDLDCSIDTTLIRKYLLYSKLLTPILTQNAINKIVKYYVKIRTPKGDSEYNPVPISARQLEGMIRMSEAYAKLRHSKEVTESDAEKAINLLHHCLQQIAYDEDTGTIDIDRIATGTTASQRNKIAIVELIIKDLIKKIGKTVPIENIKEIALTKGLSSNEVESTLSKLKKTGDIFEPRGGFISRL